MAQVSVGADEEQTAMISLDLNSCRVDTGCLIIACTECIHLNQTWLKLVHFNLTKKATTPPYPHPQEKKTKTNLQYYVNE